MSNLKTLSLSSQQRRAAAMDVVRDRGRHRYQGGTMLGTIPVLGYVRAAKDDFKIWFAAKRGKDEVQLSQVNMIGSFGR
ncbi:MAG: hypothetical protein WAZ18_03830, partial [Alphaproteobacteria bacterium]